MYKKILAAYDGSEKSQTALDHAADLADYHHALLIIVHVMREKPPASYSLLYPDPITMADAEVEEALPVANKEEKESESQTGKGGLLLQKARNRLYLEDNQVTTKLLYGEPVEEILNFSKSEKADLLIMGSSGLNGLRKFMLGNVSQKIAQYAECPVLIIK